MGRDLQRMVGPMCGTVRSRIALIDPTGASDLSFLRSPRVIAILLAFLLSGAGLALLLTGVFGGRSADTAGPITGSPPTFTTTGDRWTLDQVLGAVRSGEI